MKNMSLVTVLAATIVLGGCANGAFSTAPPAVLDKDLVGILAPDLPHETMLIVSLDDGSVIKQTIQSTADLCFKKLADSATTCLTQGAPIVDPVTAAVIGFEMVEARIDLVAKID
jgi:hypothetical protein